MSDKDSLPQFDVAGATKRFKIVDVDNPCNCVPEGMWNDSDIIAEPKSDGHRFKLHITSDGNRFDSRRPSVDGGLFVEKTDSVPLIRDFAMPELVGTVLDGELRAGKDSNSTAHALGSRASDEEKASIKYVVFDILVFKGTDVRDRPDRVRRSLVEMCFQSTMLGKCPSIELMPRPAKMTPQQKKQVLLDAMAAGEEGIMLKDVSKPYGKGWSKVKREARYDVIITGYDDPKPTSKKKGDTEETPTKFFLNGWIGAIKFGQLDSNGIIKEMGQCSGMDENFRKEVSENKEKFLGTVIEIAAQERFPTGRFRHPRFIRVRDDKPASECIYREDEI